MIEFKLIGDWRKYQRAFMNLPSMVKSAGVEGQRKAAERLVKIVKAHINNQDLGWAERSENTKSDDSRILVNYGEYLGAIKAWRKDYTYFVGVKRDVYNSKGVSISEIASYHEYGSDHEPARPLWGPSMEELGGNKGVRMIVIEALYKKISTLKYQGFDVFLEIL